MSALENYLRTYRRRTGLSQADAAFLMGLSNKAVVYRHEGRVRLPDLRVAIAYEKLYRAPVSELFAGIAEKVEHVLRERAQVLAQEMAGLKGRHPARKRAMLALLAADDYHPDA